MNIAFSGRSFSSSVENFARFGLWIPSTSLGTMQSTALNASKSNIHQAPINQTVVNKMADGIIKIMEQDNKEIAYIHELAKKFESKIKETVTKKFSVAPDDLYLLLGDEDGVYLSQEEPGTLCCLVVGQKNGFLYLVTAKIGEDGQSLDNFKSDIVS